MRIDGYFRIPHPQISLKQCSNIGENVVYFLLCVGGEKMIKDFRKTQIKKKIKNGKFIFVVDILQLPHTVISNSEKCTHPNVQCVAKPHVQCIVKPHVHICAVYSKPHVQCIAKPHVQCVAKPHVQCLAKSHKQCLAKSHVQRIL